MAWSRRRRAAARAFGKQGAKRRMLVLSNEDRSRVARQAVTARWKATSPAERSELARRAARARWARYRKRKAPQTRARRKAGLS